MKFFPYTFGENSIEFAISASITSQSSFLNNFGGTPVNTASLALNITGSQGASGTSVLVAGIEGPVGDKGAPGPAGKGIYVLPPDRTTYLVSTEVTLGAGGAYICGTPSVKYSSNCWNIQSLSNSGTGCTLYSGIGCNPPPASDGLYVVNVGARFPLVYSITDSGCMTYIATCFLV